MMKEVHDAASSLRVTSGSGDGLEILGVRLGDLAVLGVERVLLLLRQGTDR